jgi:hypothetical protein
MSAGKTRLIDVIAIHDLVLLVRPEASGTLIKAPLSAFDPT